MNIISVSQLTGYIKEKLENDIALSNIWIKGELSNFKHHSSGHMYFTLKDRQSALKCIMFRSRNSYLNFVPSDGMAVIIRGYISVYERDGQYQLYVQEMQPDGLGALHTAFLALKEKLEQEGLFDTQRKRPLPGFPKRIGVITSPTGAAVRDIINVVTRRFPVSNIILIPVKVQGDDAPAIIAEGIRQANLIENIDVLIVGRGGGSIEELWAFNTEIVARSIYSSRIPVISAVGHETDFTIADFVADLRAPTPSAAAELVVPDYQELQKHINNLSVRLAAATKAKIAGYKEKVRGIKQSVVLKRPFDDLYRRAQELDYLAKRLQQATNQNLTIYKNKFTNIISKLDSMSPLATLERGYSICTNKDGKVVKNVKSLGIGDEIDIIMNDGSLNCSVNRIREGK